MQNAVERKRRHVAAGYCTIDRVGKKNEAALSAVSELDLSLHVPQAAGMHES